ncbi:hypothetical protein J3U21_00145 [Gilliamella sp. B2776]|uniref:hypothetical protein n=1 Tax=unclassified Gilliamella TaxID=2685620 RepID=UPI00226A60C5|nr:MULTISPECIES: hypothetical protein [unclassified Gilliamella]MCX8648746.1 hypothetical protein [Gilliamella sp. B2779]MCX8653378.1 hypothetical protein [Gilliamella sp. B2737]MCX8655654.1 hypothetical protein [Gilliamella sp. B2894]MCX8664404.1 hypothetical protein [Gilliamella sp. B2887]MCX8690558.1 hypothetical protein [Gilliamella sp. B2776]
MEKLAFFKLPFIFIALFFFCSAFSFNIRFGITFISTFHDYEFLWGILYKLAPYQLLRTIPECLLLFGISTISLHRVNVHQVTSKNITLLMFNVIIVCMIGYLINAIAEAIFDNILINMINMASWLFILVLCIIPYSLCYLFSGLFTYYYIKVLNHHFDKGKQIFELTIINSTKIHFTLFLVFFFFILIAFPSFILDVLVHNSYYFISVWEHIFLPICCYLFSLLVVILVSKNMFTQMFVVLQTDRIIKCAISLNLIIFILNFVLWKVANWLIYYVSLQNTNLTSIVIILLGAISFTLSCLFIRKLTKYYFHPSFKYQINL